MRSSVALLVAGAAAFSAGAVAPKASIIFVLTDDEDTVLGGDSRGAMPAGLPALDARGATLDNWFVHTPVCACSRSEILTGKFFHNLADVRPDPEADPWDRQGNTHGPCFPDRPGGGCGPPSSAPGRNMHLNFSLLSPGPTFAQHLAAAGWRVGIFGKYTNRVPVQPSGRPQIPTGVHTWFVSPGDEANKSSAKDHSGEYFPSFYYDQAGVWENTDLEYETAFLGNRSLAWIRDAARDGAPFFLYLAPHSPHGASLPAPWYADLPINETAPITPSYNYSGLDHHWLIRQQPPLSAHEAVGLDKTFQKRWRCLRATDDLLLSVTAELKALGINDRTYVFFTSDHGFHFGELRLGAGKWNVYETDVRVPMRISGPGIAPNSKLGLVGSHVDLAATWLGLAGLDTPADMDGRSLVRALVDSTAPNLPSSVVSHLNRQPGEQTSSSSSAPTSSAPTSSAPTSANRGGAPAAGGVLPVGGAYIEYHGLGLTGSPGRLGDAFNNTYRALRVIDRREGGLGNVLFSEFGDFEFSEISFREFFELDSDPWQKHNVYETLSAGAKAAWAKRLGDMFSCRGAQCRMEEEEEREEAQ
jgi:N-acetylglucosamine-6-sulfatase